MWGRFSTGASAPVVVSATRRIHTFVDDLRSGGYLSTVATVAGYSDGTTPAVNPHKESAMQQLPTQFEDHAIRRVYDRKLSAATTPAALEEAWRIVVINR